MGKITLSADRYNAAIRNLSRFFEYDKLTEISEDDSAILETSFNINKLHNAYNSYIDSQHLNESIINSLCLVSYALRKDNLGLPTKISDNIKEWIKADLLQLYLAVYGTNEQPTWISLRSADGTIRLRNFCNWFMDDMVKDYLRKHLSNINSIEQAEQELKRIKGHRGRIPTDPRIAILMWGTYSLIREYCSFRSPMPNRLCQFIIAYLQILDILPTDTEIDTFWVRAQLRYIRSKKETAFNNNQSSIMNGAQ